MTGAVLRIAQRDGLEEDRFPKNRVLGRGCWESRGRGASMRERAGLTDPAQSLRLSCDSTSQIPQPLPLPPIYGSAQKVSNRS